MVKVLGGYYRNGCSPSEEPSKPRAFPSLNLVVEPGSEHATFRNMKMIHLFGAQSPFYLEKEAYQALFLLTLSLKDSKPEGGWFTPSNARPRVQHDLLIRWDLRPDSTPNVDQLRFW